MKNDLLYWSLARGLDWLVWRGEIINLEALPTEYPVVFVANHAEALGPIGVVASLPVRVYPWVISDMMEWDDAAQYLCKDFVEPQLHVLPPFSITVSKLLSQVSVRLLRAIGCISVWNGNGLLKTYGISLNILIQGKSLLIFPESSVLQMNELYMMTPFEKSFARLGELYFKKTRKILAFVPVAIHPLKHKIKIGKAILYNPHNDPALECIRIKRLIESLIHDLYLNINFGGYEGIPLPH